MRRYTRITWKSDPRYEMGQRKELHVGQRRRYKRGHKSKQRNSRQVKRLREILSELYGKKCAYCGETDLKLTIDHIWPKSEGGTWELTNLQLLCWPCHSRKDGPQRKRKAPSKVLKIIEKWKVRL